MQLHVTTIESIACVSIEGRLDTLTSRLFDDRISQVVENEKHLILDFSKCSYLSSTGIRSLMIVSKKLTAKGGGKLFLAAVPPDVFHVLEMAGLQQVFQITETVEAGVRQVKNLMDIPGSAFSFKAGKLLFEVQIAGKKAQTAFLWKEQGIAGYDELGFAVGMGSPAETATETEEADALFVTTGMCAGFIPLNKSIAPDFRITTEPSRAGIAVMDAISFHEKYNAFIKPANAESISWKDLLPAFGELLKKMQNDAELVGFVIADQNKNTPSISIGLFFQPGLSAGEHHMETCFLAKTNQPGKFPHYAAASYMLDKLYLPPDNDSLNSLFENNFSFINLIDLTEISPETIFTRPLVWLFIGSKTADAAQKRISIDAQDEFNTSTVNAFLARRLYNDSSRLELKSLQGGFSAQTYQVTSWDAAGRKLRPTVLKIANRDMITREAKRCREYAMPYILNNSAMILGTEFFGETGALRYNFVGIGGQQSRLKWLTHYFTEWTPEQLEPLFNKIFLEILKPWYGQAVKQTIYPYRDHDPTVTFFPDIFERVQENFGVSSDDQYITVNETGKKLLNPYWFLKHEYPARRNFATEYFSAICHGDLNMQNILLDEQMNVYLIDFSETRPRSVVSDFARLEAVFMIEFIPVETREAFVEVLDVISKFYNTTKLDDSPGIKAQNPAVRRSLEMSLLMRRYAQVSADGNAGMLPYTLALLEWVLPVVCYRQANTWQKRLSMVIAGLLCEKLVN